VITHLGGVVQYDEFVIDSSQLNLQCVVSMEFAVPSHRSLFRECHVIVSMLDFCACMRTGDLVTGLRCRCDEARDETHGGEARE
jgi:hypothetical protein